MRIHCLRHGVTHANVAGRFNAHDDPLTDAECAALSAVVFDASGFDAVHCSPSRRAVQTAQCLRIAHFTIEPRIAERNFGIFEGLTSDECAARFPDEFSRFRTFDADFVVPRGESRAQNFARVLEWVHDVATHRDVLAVTHGGTIDFLYRLAMGANLHGGDRIYAGANATLAIFDVDWPNVRLVDFDAPLTIG